MMEQALKELQDQVSRLETKIKSQDDRIQKLTSINSRLCLWSVTIVIIVLASSIFFTRFAGKMVCMALNSVDHFKQILAYGGGGIIILAILAAVIISLGYFTKEIYTSLKEQ